MRFYFAAIVSLLMAMPAAAQWYARGEFNGFGTQDQLTLDSGFHYVGTISEAAQAGSCATDGGSNVDNFCDFKLANSDFTQAAPPNNSRVFMDHTNPAEITFHLYDNTNWTDGWFPNNQRRVGYDDTGLHGWDLMGSFDGFTTGVAMTEQGDSGVYHAQVTLDPGFYDFKFRKTGDWNLNYGKDFSNGSDNNTIRALTNDQVWNFELDLPGGRWRAYPDDPQPDRNGDEHATAVDYVLARQIDGPGPAIDAWRGAYGYSPWFMRGSFNDFGGLSPTYLMVDQGGGHYTGTVSGLTAGQDHEYKLANFTFTNSQPGSNGKVPADASGQINFHLWEQPEGGWTDGWSPKNDEEHPVVNRVGYDDHDQYDWEVVGSFNGWPNAADPTYFLDDQTAGLHSKTFTFATAGEYFFKFRKQGDFLTSIGENFGNSAADNSFTVLNDGDEWTFELDLPNGRWRAYQIVEIGSAAAVPEPASIVLVLLGALAGLSFTRRR